MMKKEIFKLKKNATTLLLTTLLFCMAGAVQINAQNLILLGKSEIPQELISATKYSITKSVQPALSFNSTTPYFETLEVVNENNQVMESVITSDITNADSTVVNRVFDFTRVSPGIYYAKGVLTGAFVFYQIDVIN